MPRSAPASAPTENDPKQTLQRHSRVLRQETAVFSLNLTTHRGKEQGSQRVMLRTSWLFHKHAREPLLSRQSVSGWRKSKITEGGGWQPGKIRRYAKNAGKDGCLQTLQLLRRGEGPVPAGRAAQGKSCSRARPRVPLLVTRVTITDPTLLG